VQQRRVVVFLAPRTGIGIGSSVGVGGVGGAGGGDRDLE
jgi:hypothetical protein